MNFTLQAILTINQGSTHPVDVVRQESDGRFSVRISDSTLLFVVPGEALALTDDDEALLDRNAQRSIDLFTSNDHNCVLVNDPIEGEGCSIYDCRLAAADMPVNPFEYYPYQTILDLVRSCTQKELELVGDTPFAPAFERVHLNKRTAKKGDTIFTVKPYNHFFQSMRTPKRGKDRPDPVDMYNVQEWTIHSIGKQVMRLEDADGMKGAAHYSNKNENFFADDSRDAQFFVFDREQITACIEHLRSLDDEKTDEYEIVHVRTTW